jgi:hypothetical protein
MARFNPGFPNPVGRNKRSALRHPAGHKPTGLRIGLEAAQ